MESESSIGNTLESSYQLVDFDWRVKALLGTSSSVAHPPPPLVQLDFNVCDNALFKERSGIITDTVHLEMNSQELKTLLSTLEKVINS